MDASVPGLHLPVSLRLDSRRLHGQATLRPFRRLELTQFRRRRGPGLRRRVGEECLGLWTLRRDDQ